MLSSQPRPELYISYLRLGVLSPFALHQRSQASKVSYFFVFFSLASAIERFHSRGQQLLLDQKKTFTFKKEFNCLAGTGLFWNTNMAALTS